MKHVDVLRSLTRTDKWYLGGGNRLLWAPPFPVFLESPGFWDEAHYYNYELKPLFTWTILTEQGAALEVRFKRRKWNPAVLTQEYEAGIPGSPPLLKIQERKSLLSNDVASCVLDFTGTSRKGMRFSLIAWTVQEHAPSGANWLGDVAHRRGMITFRKFLRPSVNPHIEVCCSIGISGATLAHNTTLSEKTSMQPHWKLSPWFDSLTKGKLPKDVPVTTTAREGLMYMALQSKFEAARGKQTHATIAFAASPSPEESRANLQASLRQPDSSKLSTMSWNEHFDSVPSFRCSDEYFSKAYWYRWYGLRLNTQFGTEGNYKYPFASEGIGYFRAPISYSAQCHMRENRWMQEPDLARGSLLTFLDNQREDGGFRGYIDPRHYRQEMFYHANWGAALLELHKVHPSLEYLDQVYEGLKRYASYFDRERDEEVSGLYDIDNHYETGQEYMHRYTAVNPRADEDHWGEVFRLKGVDVTVYIYELKRALAIVADRLGKSDDAELWKIEAEKIRNAVREKMWDSSNELFSDVDPVSGLRTGIKAATCFYPYATDIVDEKHVPGLKRHLLNPREFWTPFPVPSSSVDDEMFSPKPEWKGKRMNCPWNGRVWPMTNSHIADALATAAITFNDATLRRKAAEFVTKFIRMMFTDGDPQRPNSYEHYNPFTGTPSAYRGIDDYQHSWVNDLIIQYVCGVRPGEFSVVIDPFPFNLESVSLDDLIIRGRRFRVEVRRHEFTVWLDGRHHAKSSMGKPVQVQV